MSKLYLLIEFSINSSFVSTKKMYWIKIKIFFAHIKIIIVIVKVSKNFISLLFIFRNFLYTEILFSSLCQVWNLTKFYHIIISNLFNSSMKFQCESLWFDDFFLSNLLFNYNVVSFFSDIIGFFVYVKDTDTIVLSYNPLYGVSYVYLIS